MVFWRTFLNIMGAMSIALQLLLCNPVQAADSLDYPKYPVSCRACLKESWQAMLKRFVRSDGCIVSGSADYVSSESQSYGLLISVFIDDRNSFDQIWNWTRENLSNADFPERGPFAWKWAMETKEKDSNKKQGQVADRGSASDADEDIAFALILAYEKWKKEHYLAEAKQILARLWEQNTAELNDKRRIMLAGEWAKSLPNYRINLSYFAPAEYKVFAKYDRDHNWLDLVDSSYDLVEKDVALSRLQLPGDWADVRKLDASLIADKYDNSSIYSYDALRVPWRLAFDWECFADKRAKNALEKFAFLRDSWKQSRSIKVGYSQTGAVVNGNEMLASFATAVCAVKELDKDAAEEILRWRIMPAYNRGLWDADDFYQNAWVWFSIALSTGELSKDFKLVNGNQHSK